MRLQIKKAWRNIISQKLFSILNVGGLAIAFAVTILLLSFVWRETNFNKFHSNWQQIYRVNTEFDADYNNQKTPRLPNAVAPAMLAEVTGVNNVARLVKRDFGTVATVKAKDHVFSEGSLYLADSTLFQIFDFQFIEGDSRQVFAHPHNLVISASTRDKLFGERLVVGETIIINNRDSMHISGVFQDLPDNGTLDANMVYNIMDSWMGKDVYWSNASYETYCLLDPLVNPRQVEKQTDGLLDKYMSEDRFLKNLSLQPLSKVHLYSTHMEAGYSARSGNHITVKVAILLAIVTLVIACINYMNLATARSAKNAKDVGVSKILGATRSQIVQRFYTEAAIIAGVAMLVGYNLALLCTPYFENITQTTWSYAYLMTPEIWVCAILLWAAVTLLAGSYPAYYMHKITPLILMNQGALEHAFANRMRRVLVVCQFSASIILLASIITIAQQMQYVQQKDLGYEPTGVVAIPINSISSKAQLQTFSQALRMFAGTTDLVAAQSLMGSGESGKRLYKRVTDTEGMAVWTNTVNGPIAKTFRLNLLAGHDLPEHLSPTDTTVYVLINQTVATYLGYTNPEDAIGQPVATEMSKTNSIIAGVLQDFHYTSLRENVGGYMYYRMNRPSESQKFLFVRFQTGQIAGFLSQLEGLFKQHVPDGAFGYQFTDDHVARMYREETRMTHITGLFSGLAILISCLGLFGLASATAEQRTKEIGIRKVLGSSVTHVVLLISKDFFKLVCLAIVIATPIAWWAMHSWLSDFTYRIQLSWWVFGLAGLTALFIATLTVSGQAIRAALTNPVQSLRDE